MQNVIRISLIGAGLVILGLMVLWLLMDLLVRITSTKTKSGNKDKHIAPSTLQNETGQKQKAAAAATAVAIALLKTSFLSSDKKIDPCLTAWQSAHRNNQLHNQPPKVNVNRNTK